MLGNITTGMTYLMASFGNNIDNFNKEICSIGTDLCACGEDTGNLLPHIFTTYADISFYNGPFTRYIEILENNHNNRTLNL